MAGRANRSRVIETTSEVESRDFACRKKADQRAGATLLQLVEQHSAQNDRAKDDQLRSAAHSCKVHAVLNDGDYQRTDECAKNFALAARKAGAADYDGRDDVHLIHQAI